MKSPSVNEARLQKALAKAYRTTPVQEIGNYWQIATLKRIRETGSLRSSATVPLGIGRLAWRLAPVSSALILALGSWVIFQNISLPYQLASLLLAHVFEYDVVLYLALI